MSNGINTRIAAVVDRSVEEIVGRLHGLDPRLRQPGSRLYSRARAEVSARVTAYAQEATVRDPFKTETTGLEREISVFAEMRRKELGGIVSGTLDTAGSDFNRRWADAVSIAERIENAKTECGTLTENSLLSLRRQLRKHYPEIETELGSLISRWNDTDKKFRDFFGSSPGQWDLENANWTNIDWTGFEESESFAKQFPELKNLAQRIGRAKPSARETRDILFPAPSDNAPEPPRTRVEIMGRSGIRGYTEGRSLDLLPPMELALLSDADAQDLFLKRYAEAKLTNVDYVQSIEHFVPAAPELQPKPLQESGPVIMCIDTSGSMTGIPEQVARALVLALVKSCLAEDRGVYLVAFSTEIRTLDLSRPGETLIELARFLGMSFRGGTDLRPALAESLRLLSESPWVNADLLIVSDFRVPKIMIKRSRLIDAIRRSKSARIHALSITPEEPTDDLHIFDSRWHFRIDSRGNPAGIAGSQFREAGA